jgi:hypothetical protein
MSLHKQFHEFKRFFEKSRVKTHFLQYEKCFAAQRLTLMRCLEILLCAGHAMLTADATLFCLTVPFFGDC